MMQPSGASWLFPLLMVIVMIVVVAGIAWVARAALSRPTLQQSALDNDHVPAGTEPPLAVLQRRYVRGEIDLEEFERRAELLIRNESSPQHELPARSE